MTMPAELRTMTVAQLKQHAMERFQTEINGKKPELIQALEDLYSDGAITSENAIPGDNAPEQDDQLTPEQVLESGAEPREDETSLEMGSPQPYEGTDPVLPELAAVDPAMNDMGGVGPENHKFGKETVRIWPSKVKWLYNPTTGCRFRATPELRRRMDLVPCDEPKDYKGY